MRAADRRLVAAALLSGALSISTPARAELLEEAPPGERIPTTASVNGAERGELFAWRDGAVLWVALEEIEAMGVPVKGADARDISGRPHVRLDRLEGVKARFDEEALALAIEVDPALLGAQHVDLSRVEDLPITPFSGFSGFVNAGVTADKAGGTTSYEGRMLGSIAARGWLARSEHQAIYAGGSTQWFRLQSFAQRDWPAQMLRLLIGDFDTSAGSLSRAVSLAGVSFGTAFELRPGFVSAPTARVTGIAPTASTAEIYVDGVLVATRPMRPGPYDFTNLQDFSGLRDVEVVLRDASGLRSRIRIPYYFSERLLKEGLTDFNVSWGVRRDDGFSNSYGPGMFSGHYIYGVTDALTFGVLGQRAPGYTYAGFAGGLRLGTFGVVATNVGAQRVDGGPSTFAGVAAWSYTRGKTTVRLGARAYEEGFRTAESEPTFAFRSLKREVTAGWDQNFGRLFLLSLNAAERRYHGPIGIPEREYGANLSISLFGLGNLNLLVLNRRIAGLSTIEGSANLSIAWGDRYRASAGWRRDIEGAETSFVEGGRSEPQGEGYGWRAFAQQSAAARDVQADGVWRARHGVVSGSARSARFDEGPPSSGGRISADAALACVGASCYVTRPVTDAFAVVDLNGVEGVRVSRNNEMIGRTDRSGEVVIASVPALTRNTIEIADEDVPISVAVQTNEQLLVPAQGVGYHVRFDLRRIASVTGKLLKGSEPLDNLEFVLREANANAPVRTLRTGRGGEFQADQVGPGRHQVQVELEDGMCNAWIEVPESREPVFKAGEVRCEMLANF